MFTVRLFSKNSNLLYTLTWTKCVAEGWLAKNIYKRNPVKAIIISNKLLAGVIKVLKILSSVACILDIV